MGAVRQPSINEPQDLVLKDKLKEIGRDWIDRIPDLVQTLPRPLTKAQRAEVRTNLAEGLQGQKARKICNWLVVGIVADQDYWFRQARNTGIFRASRSGYSANLSRYIATTLLSYERALRLTPLSKSYLQSVLELLRVAPAVRAADAQLIKNIRKHRTGLLKGLVAVLDSLFLLRNEFGQLFFEGLIPEDYANGFSYLYYKLTTIHGLHPSDVGAVPERLLNGRWYLDLLRQAVAIKRFMEWEVLVDAFGYNCSYDDTKRELNIAAPDPTLEKSISLGYTQQFYQELAILDQVKSPQIASVESVAAGLREAMDKAGLIQLKTTPSARYVFLFPKLEELRKLLVDERLFLEDLAVRAAASRDLHIAVPELEAVKVPETTIVALLRMQRWFGVVRSVINSFLVSRIKSEPGLVLQSLVPVFDRARIADLLSMTDDSGSVSEILDLLNWKSDSESVFDVMYQPFVSGPGESLMLPLNIIASTNVIRNSLQLKHIRISMNTSGDPLPAYLEKRLLSLGLLARGELTYSFKGKAGDIDSALLLGDHLFIWECKNSLHPTGPFELRTSYDLILKATEQLDQFLECWADQSFRRYLANKLGWNLDRVAHIVTGIVTGNRMFLGYRSGAHAVRSYHELLNFIVDGKIWFADQAAEVRPGGPLQPEDLAAYFVQDSVHGRSFAAMEREDAIERFGTITVRRESYRLNVTDLAKRFGIDLPT